MFATNGNMIDTYYNHLSSVLVIREILLCAFKTFFAKVEIYCFWQVF